MTGGVTGGWSADDQAAQRRRARACTNAAAVQALLTAQPVGEGAPAERGQAVAAGLGPRVSEAGVRPARAPAALEAIHAAHVGAVSCIRARRARAPARQHVEQQRAAAARTAAVCIIHCTPRDAAAAAAANSLAELPVRCCAWWCAWVGTRCVLKPNGSEWQCQVTSVCVCVCVCMCYTHAGGAG
jgi:hypothetical protein